jgi:hypothetical protein
MWGFFCFPKKLQGCNFWWIMTGPISKGVLQVRSLCYWIGVEFSLLKKNKIVFGGMKFSYYIYLNKTQTLWMIE